MIDGFPHLELDRPAPGILRITLRAAGRLNAVGADAHGELAAIWKAIDADDETRVVLVRGADKAAAVARWLEGGATDLPITRIPSAGTIVVLDPSAAADLRTRPATGAPTPAGGA